MQVSTATREKLIRFGESGGAGLRIKGVFCNEGLAKVAAAAANSSKDSCNVHLPWFQFAKGQLQDFFCAPMHVCSCLFLSGVRQEIFTWTVKLCNYNPIITL